MVIFGVPKLNTFATVTAWFWWEIQIPKRRYC